MGLQAHECRPENNAALATCLSIMAGGAGLTIKSGCPRSHLRELGFAGCPILRLFL
jgi:hypothetical protein